MSKIQFRTCGPAWSGPDRNGLCQQGRAEARMVGRAARGILLALSRVALIAVAVVTAAVATGWGTGHLYASAQDVIPDAVSCDECRLTWDVEVTLGTEDGSGSLPGAPSFVTTDSQGRHWLSFPSTAPMVFDSSGAFVQSVGRFGQGPGEFLRPVTAAPVADSVVVYDRAGRLMVFDPNLDHARSIRVPVPAIEELWVRRWPDSVATLGWATAPNMVGLPWHELDVSGDEARVRGSFGADDGQLPLGAPDRLMREQVALDGDGGAWTVPGYGEYRIRRWTEPGEMEFALVREASWFPEGSDGLSGGPDVPPSPRIVGIKQDAESLLWVIGLVPSPGWERAWEEAGIAALPEETAEVPVSAMPSMLRLRRTMIEVLDPETLTVVWREPVEAYALSWLQDGRLSVYRETDEGFPFVDLVRVRLEVDP